MVADATTRGNLLRAANEPVGCTAEQLSKLFLGDYEKYGRLIRELNKHRLKSLALIVTTVALRGFGRH